MIYGAGIVENNYVLNKSFLIVENLYFVISIRFSWFKYHMKLLQYVHKFKTYTIQLKGSKILEMNKIFNSYIYEYINIKITKNFHFVFLFKFISSLTFLLNQIEYNQI